jgi:hypothetical protein
LSIFPSSYQIATFLRDFMILKMGYLNNAWQVVLA